MAGRSGQTEIVKLLLASKGININIKNNQGQTAFDITYKNGHIQAVKLLVFEKFSQTWKLYKFHTLGITILAILLNYFFYATTHNSVTT